MKRRLPALLAALLLPLIASALPTGNGPTKHLQSTGDTLTFTTVGVRPEVYAQTLDGYTLWHTASGDIVYAMPCSGTGMTASTVLATDNRSAEEQAFLATIPKELHFAPAPLTSPGNLMSGIKYPSTAMPSDSLLVVLVDFPDVQFAHDTDVFENLFSQPGYDGTGSFKDYYLAQSGGRFNPGVRVIGPLTMPQTKVYYNQSSWLGTYTKELMRNTIQMADSLVDFSHYDIDSDGVADAVVVFYAGGQPSSSSQGLWPHQGYITGAGTHDGKTFSNYCIFPEGTDPMPTIGTTCHEFGHMLGLPDLYDVGYSGNRNPGWLNLMATGNENGGGKLPPNMSVMEKYLLGWAEIDTLTPGDSIGITALGTATDRGWYLPTGDGQFLMFEARTAQNQWDAGLGFSQGGLIVYHGKDSWGTNNRVNYYANDEGWYPIRACGDAYQQTADADGLPFASTLGYSNFTPTAPAKPTQNNGTRLDSIWITDIRWTSDSTMAFAYDTMAPDRNIVDIETLDSVSVSIVNSFSCGGYIVSTKGALTAKGLVHSFSPETCTLEQGVVVADTTFGNDSTIAATVAGLEVGVTYYYRMFVTSGDSTGYSPIRTFAIRCSVDTTFDTTVCFNTIFEGQHYTADQLIERTLTSAVGCDSLVTINLHVLPQRIGGDTLTLCYGAEYDSIARYTDTAYVKTITEDGMCDSTVNVSLSVWPELDTVITDTMVHGGSYEWGDTVITAAGTYARVLASEQTGCDSTVTLHLYEKPDAGIDGSDIAAVAKIYFSHGHIIVESLAANPLPEVKVYDTVGRLLHADFSKHISRYPPPCPGIYLVRIGTLPAQKLVVTQHQ